MPVLWHGKGPRPLIFSDGLARNKVTARNKGTGTIVLRGFCISRRWIFSQKWRIYETQEWEFIKSDPQYFAEIRRDNGYLSV